jgi:hypothetical protein
MNKLIGLFQLAFLMVEPLTAFTARQSFVARVVVPQQLSFLQPTVLRMSTEEDGLLSSESDQTLLGAAGSVAALVTLYSEFILKTTGCGLPAGPFGLVGAVEGVSYLGIVGLAGLSLYKKVKTGSGLPAGPGGLLGAAEGLSFLAILVGLVVVGFQVMDYGYIPNAVPMEGGMCS